MPVVTVNMKGVDPKESREGSSDFKQPPAGMHQMEIVSCDAENAKSSGNPQLVVTLRATKAEEKGQVWHYLSFSEESFARQKMDQFLQAVGVLTDKKRSASFDPAKLKGKKVSVLIADDEYNGKRKAAVSGVYEDGHEEDEDEFDAEADTEEEFEAEEFEEDEEETPEDEDDEEAAGELLTQSQMETKSAEELRALLEEYGVKTALKRVPSLVKKLWEVQTEYCEQNGFDLPEDSEDEDEVAEDDEDEDDGFLTEAQLKAMDRKGLIEAAKDFDVKVTGKKPSVIIKEILEAQAAPEEDDDDEEPF